MKKTILTFILLTITTPVFAKEMIIFAGVPEIKISERGINRVTENITKDKTYKFKCTITKIQHKYYRTSRENEE